MPGYKATVLGEKVEFIIDEETQYLDFISTVLVNAENRTSAEESALAMVREELLSQSLIEEWDEAPLIIDEINQVDVLANTGIAGDFIWTFPEDDEEQLS
ncbi:MAG: hypothetical protein PVG20_07400 [Thioalkalispiraceae bacterium]|jgi:hypothetical protein